MSGGASPVSFVSKFTSVLVGARSHLAAAAAARAASIFAMYPVDTIKTKMQMGLPAFSGAGVGTYYRGVAGSLLGQVPYGMLTFGSYEVYKETLASKFPAMNLGLRTFAAAIMGDLTGSFWLCPSEVVKQQIQGGMHSSVSRAVSSIWASQGARGFYRGYGAQISRDVPFRACQLVSYELVKQAYLRVRDKANAATEQAKAAERGALEAWEGAFVGAVAGSFSAGSSN